MTEKLGTYVYNGSGKTLEQNTEYTVFKTQEGIEAYSPGSGTPVEMRELTFNSLVSGKLDKK